MSVPDGLNKVKLGYGLFDITSIQQDAGGNIVIVAADDQPALGDYFYAINNLNGVSSFSLVTLLIGATSFRIADTSGSGTIGGGQFSKSKEIDVSHSDNTNIQLIGKKKTRLDQVILENLIGYKTILEITTEELDDDEKIFMYQFAKSDTQRAEVFSVVYSDVLLQDKGLTADLIQNYIRAVGVSMILVERDLTLGVTGYSPGETSSSGYYSLSPLGTRLKLTMNWGAGEIIRNFTVNLANIYSIMVERKDWDFLDEGSGRSTFGFRPMCQIDFGTFGYNDTPTTLEADISWVKNFCLAPSKRIEVIGGFIADVVNDFDEIRVGYVDGFIFSKTLSLAFIGRSIQDNQIDSTGIFTLDDDAFGLLDGDSQLG